MIPGQHQQKDCQVRIFVWTIAIILFGAWVHAAELKVNPSASFFVPVHLDTQEAIYSCDIRVQFDNTRLKAIGATLKGTILEGRGYQLVQNVGLIGEARFPVYSSGNLYTGKGVVLYIEFEPLVSPGEQSMLQLIRFRCNETDTQGGLWVQDRFSSEISIVVNNLPKAFDQTKEIMEDEPTVITLTASDADISDTFSYTIDTAPTLGTVDLSETTGHLTYTPNPDIFGTEHFTYVVSDGTGLSSPGHITIFIRSGNDLPLGKPATVEVTEDTPEDFMILAVDSDNDPITYELQTLPAKGTLTLLDSDSGACRYTPETNDFATYHFTFIASDSYGDSAPTAMTIVILPVNDAPVATGTAYTLNEDAPLETQLQGFDNDSGTLTYEILESSQEVSIEIIDAQRGTIKIIPGENINGEFQFSFQVSDGLANSEPATVNLLVLPENDPPVGSTGSIHLDEDTPKIFQISGLDIEDDPLSYAIHIEPELGTLSLNEQSGECHYTPPTDESGQFSFMFTTSDGQLTSEPAMFTLIIDPVNDPPVAQNDTIETLEDTLIEITLQAEDIDSSIEAFSIMEFPDGNLELVDPSTGLCQYTPLTNVFGPDVFSFTASDAESTSQPGFITINITPVNDPPVAVSMSITANEDQVRTITLDTSDPDGDSITFTLLTDPNHGEIFNFVYDNETMTVQYKPITDYYGSDQFSYELDDGQYKSNIAVVDIDVLYVNDPPFVQSDVISVVEDESVNYTLKAYDEDSQITGFKISEDPKHGQVVMINDQTGEVIYTPNEDYFGSDAFSYQCMDDASESEPAVISITVEPVNDLPVGYAKTFMVDEDIPITGNLSFDDPDYDMLTITVYTEPEHGALTITDRRTGAFIYHPKENFSGDDYILFEACDDIACSGPISMTFTIRPINDLPVVFPQSLTLNEDQPLRITLTGYDVENLLAEFEIAEYPSEGLLEIIDATAGLFQYIPERDKYGTSSFLFQVRDDIQTSAPAMVSMTILPVNDPPEATASAYTLLEDHSFDGTLEKFDADGDELTLIYSPPQHGWISSFDSKSGDFSYLPSSNYNGKDYFSYTICDLQSCSVQTSITLIIQADNDIPVVSSASYELDEDTALSLTLTAMDIDKDVLTFEITQPTKGNLIMLDAQTGACVYSPIAEDSGEVQFTYRVFDGLEYSNEAEIQLTIIAVNDDPIAFSGEIEIEEDHTYSGKVMAEDVDDEDLQYFISQKPMKGNLVISESGTGQGNFVYSPYANENGMDIFWFYVFDGDVNSAPQAFTISINPVNDPPQVEDFMTIVNAGEIKECVLNASDPDVDPITYTIVKEPEKGSVQFFDQQTGKIEYFADENSAGEDIITFRVSDGKLSSEDANLIISINPLDNYQPVANSMALTVTEGISSYFTLDASDKDNNPLTYHIFQEPGKGALIFDKYTGESTYESNLNAQGLDYIVYYVNDGIVNSDTAQITLVIQPMPEAVVPKQDILSIPVIINEEKTIESINIQVKFDPNEMEVLGMTLDNTILDSDDYGFSTQIGTNGIAVFPISSQGASITGKGVVAYLRFKILGNEGDIVVLELPKLTCNESRIFGGFELNGSISSKIRLIINEIPIAYDGNIVMDEEQILDYPLVGYDLNNDDPVSFTILSYPEKVTLTLVDAQTGQCILSGNANEYGSDSFVYQSFDGKDYSRPANMSIQINPINDRPVAYPISLTVLEDMPRSITLLGEDPADPDDTLIFRIVQKPTNGIGILLYPFEGVYIYENIENHYGMDAFTYVVDDFIEKSEPVTVNINVIPVNDAPVPKSVTYTTQEDTTFEFDLAAEDPENDIFEFILLENTNMGTLEFNSVNGHCSYQPNATISGKDSFIIQVKDIHDAISAPTTIYIVITPENDPPVVTSASSFEIMEDTMLTETLTAFDQDQDEITFLVKSQPEKGTLELTASGEFTYTPFKDQTGQDIFIVAAKDPYIESESQPITINMLPVNDPPTFEKGEDHTVLEDAGKQIVSNWAKNISAGAENESDQILSFHVTPDNAALFAEQPKIDSAGTLTYVPNNDVSGETLVSVFLQDDAGVINGGNNTSATIQYTIRIESVNDAPSFTVGQKQSVEEDSDRIDIPNWITVMNPGPTDESSQALIFHVSTDNEILFQQIPAVSPSGTLSFKPTPDQFGEAVVSISLQDDGGTLNGGIDTSITQTFIIEITPVNDPPVVTSASSFEIMEDTMLTETLTAFDQDQDEITFLVKSQPEKGTLELTASGEFTYTPFKDQTGQDIFIVAAKDPYIESESQPITINMLPVNDPPTFEKGEDHTVLEDAGKQIVSNWAKNISAGAENESDQILSFHVTPDNAALFAEQPKIDSAGTLTYVPNNDVSGETLVSVFLQDDAGVINGGNNTSATIQYTIRIESVNDAPSFTVGQKQSVEEDSDRIDIPNWITVMNPGPTDESSQALIFHVSTDNEILFQQIPAVSPSGTLSFKPTPDQFGEAVVSISLQDDGGTLNGGIDTSITQTFIIEITPVNDPPVANAGTSYEVKERHELELNGLESSDIDSYSLTYLWTIPNIPGFEIKNETNAIATITAPYVETSSESFTVTLTVTDDENASTVDTALVLVNNMTQPEVSFSADPVTGTAPLSVQFTDTSTGMPESWVWDFGDNASSFEQHPLHVYKKSGVYTITLTVIGPGGTNLRSQTELIQVNASTQPLEIDFSVNQSEGFVPFDVQFIPDITGEVTQWQWDFGDGSVSNDFNAAHTYAEIGAYTVTLHAQSQDETQTKTYENLILVKGLVLKGTVSNSYSKSLANYRVEAYLIDTYAGSAQTDAAGQYTITGLLPSKQYVVGVWPPENDTQYIFQYYNKVESLFDASYIEIKYNDENENETILDFTMSEAPQRWLTGQVTDGANPIPYTQVDIYSDRLGLSTYATTDANGVYTITGLKESSDYWVSFYSDTLETEFFYYSTEMSVKTMSQARQISPTKEGLRNIDIIVNAVQGGKIEGQVTDISGNAISGMRVNAWADSLNAGGSAITDDDGHYVITGLTPSDSPVYILKIQPDGYMYQVYNKNTKTPVATGSTDINFELQDKASLSGTIKNTGGQNIASARVQIYSQEIPSGSTKETYSSENGTYTFTDLPIRNDYILQVDAAGYPVHYFENSTDLDNATLLSLESSSKTGVDIDLDKGMVIKGKVHDQTFDVPVASGTKVTLRSDSLGRVKNTPTDDTGYFEFTGLDAAVSDYILSVIIDNYLPAYYRDNQNSSDKDDTVYNNAEALTVPAVAENEAKACHLILVQGMILTGFVSHNGEPVSGAIVEIQSDNGNWKTTTTNNSKINYTITGMMPDTYTIEITSNAYEKLSSQITIEDIMSQDFELQNLPVRTIQGTVFNLEPDKQIQLFLKSLSKNVQETITLVGTGQAYAYSFNGLLPASDYTLELKSEDYSNHYYDHVYQSDDATNIDVLNDDITGVDFTIAANLSEITGRIDFPATATNGDLVRVAVKSSSTGIEGFIEITFKDNLEVDYKINGLLPSDDYILQVRSDVYLNRYWNGANDFGTKHVENALPVSTLSGSATANLSLNPGLRIEGTVKDASGELLEGIQIDVWSDKEKVAAITHTSSDGTYSISGLEEADDYQIKATTSTNAKFYYYNETESVQIPGDAALVSTKTGDQFNMNIIISMGETIAGKVRGVNGQAISGIWVNAWSETIGVGNGVFSSDDGSFEILGIPKAQDYKLSAKPEWNQPYWSVEQNNIVAPSSAVDLVLPDKTGFTVTGSIKDESGAPVKDATVEIQSASKSDQFGWNNTDVNGQYTIVLLPEGSDYALKVKPPQNSNLAYSEQTISISANLEKNVILEAGYVFSGTIVAKDTQTNLADAEITVWSDTTHFIGEATTNINGEFSIGNVPNQSDYVVSVKADDYLELKSENQSPKTGLIYTVEKSGLIQGTVRSLLTGEVIPEASIEIYSQANQGLDVYNGVASTNQDGRYAVGGLKPVDEQGNSITDFVVTVYATGFPPVAKTGKQLGDTVSFDLTKGPENTITGNIRDAGNRAVAIDVFEVIHPAPTREDKFIKTVMVNDDSSFLIDGLRADGQFVFKFVTDDNHEQWAGSNDTGVDSQDEAKLYQTQTEINFQFTNLRKRSKFISNQGPGPVQGLKSLSHSYKLMNVRIRTAVKSTGPDKPSNDANVTVAWDPPAEGTSNLAGYYHFFDKNADKSINKFTIDTTPPIRTRKITSRDLAGDDVNYYFHVASVDKEGRVGDTTSIAFRIDTTPPTNVNVTAPKLTNRQNIDLKLGATGASEMYISNLSYAEGGQWESRSVDRVWRITDGDGSKNIYTRFRDKAGNVAKAAAITVYQPPLPVYKIQAEAYINGNISPEGNVFVTKGENITFTLTPNTDYLIDQLLLDDTPQTMADNTFTLSNVQKPHHVVATFKQANEAPIAYDKTIDIIEDTPTEFTLSAYDPDGDILEYMADNPEKGNLQLLEGNRYSYAPDKNDFGKYTFQFTVSDGDLTSNTGTVTLNIIAKNDPPEIVPINVYPDLNSAIAITLTASDVDSNSFSYTISAPPINGEVTIQENIVTYTPNSGYQGKDSFTYQANDGVDDSEMAEVTIWIGVSEADLILDEDVATLISSLPYTAQIVTDPDKGSVHFINNNRIVYVPKKNAFGEDSFTYSFESDPKTYTFTIFIKEINDAPWFTSTNTYTGKEDHVIPISLSASDIEKNTLTFGIDQRPEKGQLTANGALLTYTPAENFNGTVTMIAWVKDPYTTVRQEFLIEVEPVNDAPVAHNYFDHGGLSNSISFTLTANDIDGDPLTYHIDSKPASGSLTGSGQHWTYTPYLKKPKHEEISFFANDGEIDSNVGYIYLYFGMDVVHAYGDEDKSINIREGLEKFHGISNDESIEITVAPESGQIQADQYIPDKDFFGADQFEFKTQGKTDIFKIYVIAVDDPPVITGPGTIGTPEDISMDIVFTVEDVDSQSLGYTLISNVSHGELSGTTTRYTYTPDLNYYGDDEMTLQVSDGNSIATATVSITIHPINDAPVGKNQSLSMYEDQQLSIQLSGYDPENLPLTNFEIAMTPVHGTLSNSTSMTDWVYRPAPNYNGSDSFTFTLSDGQLTSETATVSIKIRNVNDLPYADGRSITMTDSDSISGYLYAYDHPLDHDTLIYSLQSNAKKGMVVINNPVTGAFTYYPNNYATGVDYFTFKVNDGFADSNTATMMVYISSPVSDLLRLTINLQPPYDGRNYHYLIRDVIHGLVVREDDANTRQMEHQLAKGQYQVIIRSEGFALYASPEPIVLTTNKAIGIALTQGNSPPDITMPDISHKMISGGFLLKMIPNQDNDNTFELFILDNTKAAVEFKSLTTEYNLTYKWLEDPDAVNGLYTDTLPDYPSSGDTMYTIHVQVKYDGLTIVDYPITYISYASSENADQNKPEDQKVFESTYGPSESVEFSNKLFYPLLGENLRIVVSDPQGQDIEIPIRIPSLPLSCLYIDNTLIYDESSDYYDIAASSSQTLTPQTQLLAKIKHYTFGKDSLGSGVDISFVVAETGEPVRYNPVYNRNGQRADQMNNETAPDIEVPLLLNPESDSYTSFREDLLASDTVDLFYNEKGDGTSGFKLSASAYTIDQKNKDLVKLSTNHLTGIGFAIQQAEENAPEECEDCDSSCFVGLLTGHDYFGLLWLGLFIGYIVMGVKYGLFTIRHRCNLNY
jgi:PKD repeat protein